ncbi:glutaconate CoA-transferase subunit B [Zhongshania antarctica]|uniref:Glutaconate CoA-transferase subunit B n=1 Tax=Zhongshania antarctica TaxID=641702 RepID=A0A840R372_9GAMM|nr:ketoacid CoA transferase [Zhongshania antarctica]MBB5186892.1 glutaconate CoA-transferase subunit B [Zhongshania antarctica]
MSTPASDYSLAELMICANAEAYVNDGEVLVTGIGVLQRLAASLAMLTTNPGIMMTDSEAWILSVPNPVGKRPADFVQMNENWMGFSRIFDNVWSGRRHLTGGPTQIDRYGQANISAMGGDYQKPKVQMLGVRGFPGNSICHANSYMVPAHGKRVFIEGECDVVCTIGFNPERLPKGYSFDEIDLRCVYTNLGVFDFNGPNRQMQIVSLHPGVSVEEVIENTGFDVHVPATIAVTKAPTEEQLAVIRQLDPHNLRSKQLKDNPPGVRL